MNALDLMGAAAHRKLRAQKELALAQAALDEALLAVHRGGIRKCHVGAIVRSDLKLHGFEQAQLRRLGVSDASVRVILDRLA